MIRRSLHPATNSYGRDRALGAVLLGDRLDHANDRTPKRSLLDVPEGLDQRVPIRMTEKVGDKGDRRPLGLPCGAPGRRQALEEERDRDAQNSRQLLQPARADAVRAFFVFLNLLKRQAQLVAELFLAHAEHKAAHADAAPDILVDRIGVFAGH
jgi:hypothetical protein